MFICYDTILCIGEVWVLQMVADGILPYMLYIMKLIFVYHKSNLDLLTIKCHNKLKGVYPNKKFQFNTFPCLKNN